MQKFNTPRVWNPKLHLRTLEATPVDSSAVISNEDNPATIITSRNSFRDIPSQPSAQKSFKDILPVARDQVVPMVEENRLKLKSLLIKLEEAKVELKSIRLILRKEFEKFTLGMKQSLSSVLNRPVSKGVKVHVRRLVASLLEDTKDVILHQMLPKCKQLISEATLALQSQLMAEIKLRRDLHNQVIELKGNIRVFIRIRPILSSEQKLGILNCVTGLEDNIVTLQKGGVLKQFQFDKIFGSQTDNNQLFNELGQLLTSVLDGYNVSIIAYGITGSGKTYTMEGIYERIGLELFEQKVQRGGRNWQYTFKFCMCEIYNESVIDLMNLKNLSVGIKTNPNNGLFHIPGLVNTVVNSPGEIRNLLTQGGSNRSVSSTNCNEQSSRSHLITIITAHIKTPNGKEIESKIHLVDLAGSERLDKSGATGSVAKEAVFINKSLSALGDVINARFNKAPHVPYRNSVLTSALQETLCGDAKTMMILQVSPCENSFEETCNSLVFGSRVKEVELKNPNSPRRRI